MGFASQASQVGFLCRFRDGPSRQLLKGRQSWRHLAMPAPPTANPPTAPRRRTAWASTCPLRFQRLQAPAETNSQAIPQLVAQPALPGMIRLIGVPLEQQVTLSHQLWNISRRWRGTIPAHPFPEAVVSLPRVAEPACFSQSLPGKPDLASLLTVSA